MMQARDELDSAPSILELFSSAKKLLRLQTRVENRQLRKENSKTQKSHNDSEETTSTSMNALDLLSPVSLDDLKNNNKLGITKSVTNSSTTTANANSSVKAYVTPTSMNDDSPPGSNSSNNSRNNSDTPNTSASWSSQNQLKIPQKNTPTSSNTTNNNEYNDSITKLKEEPTSQNQTKSNLTTSILQEQQQQQRQQQQHFNPRSIDSPRSNSDTASTISGPSSGTLGNSAAGESSTPTECHNCHTLKTPLWRKDPEGNTLCNACGLFQKLHGTTRPLSLKTDIIKKRNSRRLPSNTKITPGSVGNNSPGGAFSSRSRKNSFQDFSTSLPNRNPYNYPNGIPISSSSSSSYYAQNALYMNNASSLNSPARINNSVGSNNINMNNNPNFNSNSNSNSNTNNNSVGSRYKNVLILPKPQGGVSTPTSSAQSPQNISQAPTPRSIAMKGIPIPNEHHELGDPTLSISPFTNGTSTDNNKRKKVETDFCEPSSFTRRTPSQVSLSSYSKRGSTTSFQSMSLSRRTSNANFSNLQRKNSVLGNMNQGTPPTNSLTPTNIGLLNQRFSSQTGGYFESNGARNGAHTPGSERSSFYEGSHFSTNFNDEIYDSQLKGNNSNNNNNIDNAARSSGMNDDEMVTDDFFKNYTSLQNDVDERDFAEPGQKFEISIPASKAVSSLTTGLKEEKNHYNGGTGISGANQRGEVDQDLDWLKFEI
ncbi:hypothetical protein CLIB1423_13S02102 [[Candida] railenensis]|uniref:GATA-type domain-containing protein n=1 Tax=[Candida] railenensis TaxID=45579 RepID=A0A9P0QS53_9ASCO|nr:hypothetical protein CLIB1423_13S02102 [[Candida] railenensis]